MNIDRFYTLLGNVLKTIFYRTVQKPIKNFNIDNRAQKKIRKENLTPAPWPEATKQFIEQIKKESNFEQLNKKHDDLVDRLKTVKVDSCGTTIDNQHNRLPQDRYGVELPYVFYKNKTLPLGKIYIVDLLDIILSHKKDNLSSSEIALKHKILEKDVDNLLKYVDVFVAIDKDQNEIPLFVKREIDSTDSFKQIESNSEKKNSG